MLLGLYLEQGAADNVANIVELKQGSELQPERWLVLMKMQCWASPAPCSNAALKQLQNAREACSRLRALHSWLSMAADRLQGTPVQQATTVDLLDSYKMAVLCPPCCQ